jgi:hypothetical protein
MGGSSPQRYSGLIDVTQMPLAQLSLLDDALFEETLDPFLRPCDSTGDRRWNRDESIPD